MKTRWKVLLGVGALLAIGVVVGGRFLAKPGVAVQTALLERRPLTQIITASGEINPKTYVNVGADQMGRITEIRVSEGEAVVRGQVLAKLETDQPRADVKAQQAGLRLLEAELRAAVKNVEAQEAARLALEATLERAKAERERAELLYDRASKLIEGGLIARDEYDRRRADLRGAEAAIAEAQANLVRMDAEREQLVARRIAARERIDQSTAQLDRLEDVLRKYSTVSPIDGIVSNLPVKVGETVVPGIQNSPASLIMTIADMSTITAEALVDETDVVYVEVGQPVEVAVDALPDQPLAGRVSEIGNTAILRSTGLAASQSTAASQEARDFEVTITLDDPPKSLRPGMSCTVRITTAVRNNPLALPLQALTVRPGADGADREGVFVVRDGRAEFVSVKTGIAGGGWVEVVSGLDAGEEIVTGSYRVLRSLEPGTEVRREAAVE